MTSLPIHRDAKPLATWIEKLAAWYAKSFGTPTAFAISLLALIIWVAFVPILGPAAWNAGPGLLGNTIESTGEWFFEVAILIVGVTTAQRQQEIESNQLHQMEHVSALEDKLMQAVAENTALTRLVLAQGAKPPEPATDNR